MAIWFICLSPWLLRHAEAQHGGLPLPVVYYV